MRIFKLLNNKNYSFFVLVLQLLFISQCLYHFRKSGVVVELPEVECEDGSTICPLTVTWLESSGR